jgi:hypothetical protein
LPFLSSGGHVQREPAGSSRRGQEAGLVAPAG